jgi:hypothetical protein
MGLPDRFKPPSLELKSRVYITGMSKVWTCDFRCFRCGKEFIINRLTVEDAYAALALIPCPHCAAVPSINTAHRLVDLESANLPYRKKSDGQVWHYSEYCSQWPVEDFVELEFPPASQICNECRALVRG